MPYIAETSATAMKPTRTPAKRITAGPVDSTTASNRLLPGERQRFYKGRLGLTGASPRAAGI